MRRPAFVMVLSLTLAAALVPAPAAAQQETLRVAVALVSPMAMRGADGGLTGFDVDLARALCDQMQVRCDIAALKFADVFDALEQQQVDFAAAAITRTAEREKKYLFTERYARNYNSFVARADGGSLSRAPAPAGKRLAALARSVQEKYLREHYPDSPLATYPSFHDALRAVAAGQADYALAPTPIVSQFLQSPDGRGLEMIGMPLTEGGLGGDVAIALPPGREALRDRINQALRRVLVDGRYNVISARYFQFPPY